MAGYSGTPLPKKLGIKPGGRLRLDGAPPELDDLLGPLPEVTRALGAADVVLHFATSRAALEAAFEELKRAIWPAGGLWVAWPKKSSKVPTDITEDVVREVALARGLVDNKVCAISAVWSGLRLVYRLSDRKG
ncbi:MAG: DUF3052 domain-containing protein [Candidatus Lambdaproteobacteria bacterium]|nr:DUF3052 domain-containing protein [Candidatus Lambdaproteobacteria bacterium]